MKLGIKKIQVTEYYWVHIPAKKEKSFRNIIECKKYIERYTGILDNKFDIIENGIEINNLQISIYIGDKNGKIIKSLDDVDLAVLDGKIQKLTNIGKMNISYYDFGIVLQKMSREWTIHSNKNNIKKFDFPLYIQLLLRVYYEIHGYSIGSKQYNKAKKLLNKLFI